MPVHTDESVGLWLVDGSMLQPVYNLRLKNTRSFRIDEGAVGRCYRTGEILRCSDVSSHIWSDDVVSFCRANEVLRFLLFPLNVGRIRIGVLGIFGRVPDADITSKVHELLPRVTELALYLVLGEAVLSGYGPSLEQIREETSPGAYHLPKGMQMDTLSRVYNCVLSSAAPMSAQDVGKLLQFSSVTARKYLEYLAQTKLVECVVSYGRPGRPLKTYKASSRSHRFPPIRPQ